MMNFHASSNFLKINRVFILHYSISSKKSKKQEKVDKKLEHRRLGQKQGDLLLKAENGHPSNL